MKKSNLKIGISALLLAGSFTITGCNGRVKLNAVQPQTQTQQPTDNFYQAPIEDSYPNNTNSTFNNMPVANAVPNNKLNDFKVDQDTFNQWQAKGIAVSSGTIYVSAADAGGVFKKGTVVKMSSADGKSWKDLSSSLLGLRHPIDSTILGLAVSGGTILAGDSSGKMYSVDASKGSVKVLKSSPATDVASAGGSFYVSNGSLERTDSSATSRTPITGMNVSGGIGADMRGNVYAISGATIKKFDATSQQVIDVVMGDIGSAIDVAADDRNGDIYVLEQSNIKRFNSNGQLLSTFPSGASKPVGIAADESGFIYVADAGTTYKDSKVIKFSASTDAVSSQMNSMNSYNQAYNASYNNNSNDAYNYASTRRK